MEVHHHSHHGKKKWTDYFWEFLMLFLAVFAGFLAEYQLEHIIEHQKEEKYIQSLIVDLKTDTADIKSVIAFNITKFHGLDSLASLLNKQFISEVDEKRLYDLNKLYASNINTMGFNDRTIRQLLSSGNLRLIGNQAVSDSIINYYGDAKENVLGQEKLYSDMSLRLIFYSEDIFDNSFSLMKLRTDTSLYFVAVTDKMNLMTRKAEILKKYAQMIINARGFLGVYLNMLIDMSKRSERLLAFLQKKYHIE